jgi:CheY-like chemotaxis protein
MKNILWIDDDTTLLKESIFLFQKYGFSVHPASNTTDALAALRTAQFDGVLLDVRLPGEENGLRLLKEIRHQYPRMKVVVFTGYPEYDDHVKAEEDGAASYLWKIEKNIPVDPGQLQRFFATLHRVFPGGIVGDSRTVPVSAEARFWIRGSFFLLLLMVIVVCVLVLSREISVWVLPVALLAAVLLFAVAAAVVMRASGDLGEGPFVKVILAAFRSLPLLRLKGRMKAADTRRGEPPNGAEQ